jgi:hypothetical protein
MVITRDQNNEMLQYLLTNLITLVKDGEMYHPIQQFLSHYGATDYIEFMEMEESDFVSPSYKVPPATKDDDPSIKLKAAHAKKIRNLRRWILHLQTTQGTGMDWDDILNLKLEDFQSHLVSAASALMLVSPIPPLPSAIAATRPRNASQEFLRSVKRDKNQYDLLNRDNDMDRWFRGFIGTATLHQCTEILDPAYIPPPMDIEAVELFKAKNSYMYTVLNHVLQTDTRKSLGRNMKWEWMPSLCTGSS